MIRKSYHENNFPHKSLSTDTQVSKTWKAFANGWSTNVKFSKTQLSKIVQSGVVLHDISIFGNILLSIAKKGTDVTRNSGKKFVDKQTDRFNKECITGSRITLTNNEINEVFRKKKNFIKRNY